MCSRTCDKKCKTATNDVPDNDINFNKMVGQMWPHWTDSTLTTHSPCSWIPNYVWISRICSSLQLVLDVYMKIMSTLASIMQEFREWNEKDKSSEEQNIIHGLYSVNPRSLKSKSVLLIAHVSIKYVVFSKIYCAMRPGSISKCAPIWLLHYRWWFILFVVTLLNLVF